MAARGRGRGRRMMSFSVDAVGISRGDSFPPSMQQPTPAFPAMEQKPLPLAGGEEAEYLLALKQEFRGAMRIIGFIVKVPSVSCPDVERYSDKYHSGEQTERLLDWTPGETITSLCSEEEEGEEKKKQEEEEAEGEEEYDEEEFEEETDYIMSYFDNGEDFGGDSDDNMDEAIY
uniref:DNA-directed RNA polymerase III subunit n=1 Tax=Echeneis naucrates TaxID=173247 RepID=A0A665T906_ECHNA